MGGTRGLLEWESDKGVRDWKLERALPEWLLLTAWPRSLDQGLKLAIAPEQYREILRDLTVKEDAYLVLLSVQC